MHNSGWMTALVIQKNITNVAKQQALTNPYHSFYEKVTSQFFIMLTYQLPTDYILQV